MVSKSISELCIKIKKNPGIQTLKVLDLVFPTGNTEDDDHILETLTGLTNKCIIEIYRFMNLNYEHLTKPQHFTSAANEFLLEVCWHLIILKRDYPNNHLEPVFEKVGHYLAKNASLIQIKLALDYCEQILDADNHMCLIFPNIFVEAIRTQRPDVVDMLINKQHNWGMIKTLILKPAVTATPATATPATAAPVTTTSVTAKPVKNNRNYLDASKYTPMPSSTRFPVTPAHLIRVRKFKEPLFKDEEAVEIKEVSDAVNLVSKNTTEIKADENRSPNLPSMLSLANIN